MEWLTEYAARVKLVADELKNFGRLEYSCSESLDLFELSEGVGGGSRVR